ncbi:MAG: hypothetical protein LUB56_01110 [Coprobacillus sp.]|nr:hypothetical protein [Coprobacillus sp.]
MRTKLKLAVYRSVYLAITVAYFVFTIVMVFALVLKAWGLGQSETALELIIIYYVAFFLLMFFAGVQAAFIIISFKKGTAIMNNACFKAMGKTTNKYCTWICSVMIVLFGFFLIALSLRLAGVWMFMDGMDIEFIWTSFAIVLLFFFDPVCVLAYQQIFRRDFLVGNITIKVQETAGGDDV